MAEERKNDGKKHPNEKEKKRKQSIALIVCVCVCVCGAFDSRKRCFFYADRFRFPHVFSLSLISPFLSFSYFFPLSFANRNMAQIITTARRGW